eukprot:SAG22_NODE_29_length_28404_cov_23.294153_2_plen_169_part_00
MPLELQCPGTQLRPPAGSTAPARARTDASTSSMSAPVVTAPPAAPEGQPPLPESADTKDTSAADDGRVRMDKKRGKNKPSPAKVGGNAEENDKFLDGPEPAEGATTKHETRRRQDPPELKAAANRDDVSSSRFSDDDDQVQNFQHSPLPREDDKPLMRTKSGALRFSV